jgi:FAD/FMN-containing dehydrogenase
MSNFNPVTTTDVAALRGIVGDANVNADAKQLQMWSRDHYWFSPVLKPLLDDKAADVSVQPQTLEQLIAVLAYAARNKLAITPRGAGTGNYGQSVPMHRGLLLDMRGLARIVDISPEHVRAQAGAKLLDIERAANASGAELRFYPSTLTTATVGGFLAGGSGGIGSVTYGTLWDEGNVLGATVVTVEAEPRVIIANDAATLQGVIHNCGLTCIIVDLTLALAPRRPWEEFTAAFDSFEQAYTFGAAVTDDAAVHKRLVTLLEWPAPSYFPHLVKRGAIPDGKALAILELCGQRDTLAWLQARAAEHGGAVTSHTPHERYHSGGVMVSDFTWNHTTLWAMKAEPRLTYLQDMFADGRAMEQHRLRKARYGDATIGHIEFMKFKGRPVVQGLTLVRFDSKEQLFELIQWCESIGMWIANPHTHRLDEDVRWNGQPILDAKARWDPHGLLNPGHLASTATTE